MQDGKPVEDARDYRIKVVFEEQKITMDRLITSLDNNFAGDDELLHSLAAASKFGN